MGNLSIMATKSLGAIEDWMKTLNGNIIGSTRVAFKENEVMYGGNSVSIIDTPSLFKLGKQIGEQTLSTGHTVIDWSQGDLVSSSQETHFAVQGLENAFFVVAEPIPDLQTAINAGALVDGNSLSIHDLPASGANDSFIEVLGDLQNVFLTRNGEFHWGFLDNVNLTYTDAGGTVHDDPVLLNQDGLLVLGDISDGTTGGETDDSYEIIRYSEFIAEQPTDFAGNPDDRVAVRPSIVQHNKTNDDLEFSKYGSTVYKIGANDEITTTVNGSGFYDTTDPSNPFVNPVLDRRAESSTDSDGNLLRQFKLESANVNKDRNLTEVALLGKIFNAFTQLIRASNQITDEALRLVR